MFNHFCAGQNIRGFVMGNTSSSVLKRLQPLFCKRFDNDTRGTLLSDIYALDETDHVQLTNSSHRATLTPMVYRLLAAKLQQMGRPWASSAWRAAIKERVLPQNSITVRGIKYSVADTATGDSQVVFGNYPLGDWSAGRIDSIFAWPKANRASKLEDAQEERTIFLLMRVFKPLPPDEAGQDWYRLYADGGRLFQAEYEADFSLIQASEIVAHFAGTMHLGEDGAPRRLHVLPLDR